MSTNVRGVRLLEQHVTLMQTARTVMTVGIPPRAELGPAGLSGRIDDYKWTIDVGPLGGGWDVPGARFACKATGWRGRLYADRNPRGDGVDGPGTLGTSRYYRAMASELESGSGANPAQRIDRDRAAADRRRPCGRRICAG